MTTFTDIHERVLKTYSRPITHLRKQVESGRFGLVFGAGLSTGFGIPTWSTLIGKIAGDPEVNGSEILKIAPPRAGQPYQTEMLFEHFKRKQYATADPGTHHTRALDLGIGADWREIVRHHLYAEVTDGITTSLPTHPYLLQYLPLIRKAHMTVTYNFDDFIEQALLFTRDEDDRHSRGFESVTNPWTQFRRPNAIIYHPNGIVPQNRLETPSDRIVLSEGSFAEQLMGMYAGDHAGLLNHFSKNTCLMIGLGLGDDTLRSVLVQGARSCPGNYHYYVHWLKPSVQLSADERRAIAQANFNVYNLITLFLNDEEIQALGELIDTNGCSCNKYCDFAHEIGVNVRFRFYLTGSLGVGKSTAINRFRSLVVLDEWLELRPPILAKDWATLTPDERIAADDWIMKQFRAKNDVLRHEREGVFILDRGPLDPLAFSKDPDWPAKAGSLLDTICPRHSGWPVEDGRVILLRGDSHELALRMLATKRTGYTAEKLEAMELMLGRAYGEIGVVVIDTRGLSPIDVVRRIAEIIHLEDYLPICNLHERLKEIQNDSGAYEPAKTSSLSGGSAIQ